MNKRCSKCKQIKRIEGFSLNKSQKDGYNNQCKDCLKESNKLYVIKNYFKKLEYARKYYQKNRDELIIKQRNRKKNRGEEIRKRDREYAQREERKSARQAYKKNNPEKIKARDAIGKAVARGKIPRVSNFICSVCGTRQANHYHHHKGYAKENRLDVIPVCTICHKTLP